MLLGRTLRSSAEGLFLIFGILFKISYSSKRSYFFAVTVMRVQGLYVVPGKYGWTYHMKYGHGICGLFYCDYMN